MSAWSICWSIHMKLWCFEFSRADQFSVQSHFFQMIFKKLNNFRKVSPKSHKQFHPCIFITKIIHKMTLYFWQTELNRYTLNLGEHLKTKQTNKYHIPISNFKVTEILRLASKEIVWEKKLWMWIQIQKDWQTTDKM